MDLYYKMGKHEKLDTLIQEMENMGISCGKSTLYIRMNAYAYVYDIEGMERLLKKMEADPQLTLDWKTYITAANGYVKGGLVKKAIAMLKKSEELITGKSRGGAYDTLLTLYASVGKKDELYRVWAMYKKMVMIFNNGYSHMISSLVKLDDISGAEKILAEWESSNNSFDFQIPNLLINAYCKNGLFEKAKAFVSRVKGSGKEPPASTWDLLANAYHKDNQMDKAVEWMRKAALAYRLDWKLNIVTLRACYKYLTKKGDAKLAGEFEWLLVELPELQIMPKTE